MKYKQYCPVARAAEIVADRWTPLILRELLAGSRHFNAIERGLPGISRSVRADRLRTLEDAEVVTRHAGAQRNVTEYELTDAGRDVEMVIDRLGAWGVRWAFSDPDPRELDPALLIWKVHQRIARDRLPASRVVVEFDFRGPRGRRIWLVLEPREISVCLKPPGFDSDLVLVADLWEFYRVWLGHVDYAVALRSGTIRLEGPPALRRDFPRWLLWSPMAPLVRTERARRRARTSRSGHRSDHARATDGAMHGRH
jgi:DNA-binding HxlR family transcriptional regulator